MPKTAIVSLANVSHIINRLKMVDDYMVGDIEVLNTPSGRVLQRLLESSLDSVAFRTQGIGNGTVNDDGILIIRDNYKLISIHALSITDAVTI